MHDSRFLLLLWDADTRLGMTQQRKTGSSKTNHQSQERAIETKNIMSERNTVVDPPRVLTQSASGLESLSKIRSRPRKVCLKLDERYREQYRYFFMQYKFFYPRKCFDLEVQGNTPGDPGYPRTRNRNYTSILVGDILDQIGKNQLRSLALTNLSLRGNLTSLVSSIAGRQSKSLKEIHCDCRFHESACVNPGGSARLVLSTCLQKTTFNFGGVLSHIFHPETLTTIAGLKSLKELTLIAPPSNLLPGFFEALHQNSTPLQKLVIQKTRIGEAYLGMVGLTLFVEHSRTLQKLDIAIPDADSLLALVTTLETNSTLRKLLIRGCPQKPHVTARLLHLLEETNTTLVELEVEVSPQNLSTDAQRLQYDQMKFLLKLNRFHRKRLLGGRGEEVSSTTRMMDTEAWIDAIISVKDKVSVTFYYLIRNPSLLCG
jgi:hypothetical protein